MRLVTSTLTSEYSGPSLRGESIENAKRGIFFQLKLSIKLYFYDFEVGDVPKAYSHHLVMQYIEVYFANF